MAVEWEPITLAQCIEVKHGFAFKGEFIFDDPCGDILLTPGNFAIGGGFKGDKFKYYDGPTPAEYVLSEGELIVSMTDLSKKGDTLGYSALVPASHGGRRYLHNQRLGKVLNIAPEIIDGGFLNYLLRSADYRHEVLMSATGSTVRHTSPERIRRFEFRRPPLSEQRAIAHILRTLDDKIELNQRMSATLEAMARALFKAWFVDFEPVRAKAERRDPGLPLNLAALFPDRLVESEHGEVPEGWEVKPLSEVAEFLNGLALQKYPANDPVDSLPVIKISELRNGVSAKSDRASRDVPDNYIVKDGDFLFSWSGSLLAKFWTEGDGALNQHLFKVTSDRYPAWFFAEWIQVHLAEFQRIAAFKATTMGHIQRGHLRAAMTNCPPDDTLTDLGAVVSPLVERGIQIDLESRTFAALRDTLLPQLTSGDLRVKDAETFLDRVL